MCVLNKIFLCLSLSLSFSCASSCTHMSTYMRVHAHMHTCTHCALVSFTSAQWRLTVKICQSLFHIIIINIKSFLYASSLVMHRPTTQWDCKKQVSLLLVSVHQLKLRFTQKLGEKVVCATVFPPLYVQSYTQVQCY